MSRSPQELIDKLFIYDFTNIENAPGYLELKLKGEKECGYMALGPNPISGTATALRMGYFNVWCDGYIRLAEQDLYHDTPSDAIGVYEGLRNYLIFYKEHVKPFIDKNCKLPEPYTKKGVMVLKEDYTHF